MYLNSNRSRQICTNLIVNSRTWMTISTQSIPCLFWNLHTRYNYAIRTKSIKQRNRTILCTWILVYATNSVWFFDLFSITVCHFCEIIDSFCWMTVNRVWHPLITVSGIRPICPIERQNLITICSSDGWNESNVSNIFDVGSSCFAVNKYRIVYNNQVFL